MSEKPRAIYLMLAIMPRDDGGVRIRGMGELAGLYLAGADKDAVFRDLGPVLQTILHTNHGAIWLKDKSE